LVVTSTTGVVGGAVGAGVGTGAGVVVVVVVVVISGVPRVKKLRMRCQSVISRCP
jgi:hypothetical protein